MPKDGNKTRMKILNETTQLVLENGFAGTTIDHILDRTRITKGAFFYHFKSKADLAFSLMENFSRNDISELSHVLKETEKYKDNPKQRLIAFVQYFIDVFKDLDAPYVGCLYASYIYEPEQFSQEIKDMVATSFISWRKALVQIIEDASKASPPKIEIDANTSRPFYRHHRRRLHYFQSFK